MENLIFKHFFKLTPKYFTCPFCDSDHSIGFDLSLKEYFRQKYVRCPSSARALSLDVESEGEKLRLSFHEDNNCPSMITYADINTAIIDPANRSITFTFPVNNNNPYQCNSCTRKIYGCQFYMAFSNGSGPEKDLQITFEFYADDFRKAYAAYEKEADKTGELLKEKDAKIQEQQKALQEKDAKINAQQKALQEKDALIGSQKERIQSQEHLLQANEAVINALNERIDEQDEILRQYEEEEEAMSENNTALSNVNPAAPALPINFEEISKQLGINFGILHDERICSTILGTAVKCSDGTYHVYDKSRNVVRSYADLATVKLPSITIPQTSVKPGHNILHANNFYSVSKVEVNPPSVVGTNLADMTQLGIVPQENPLGMPCYTRVISLGDLLGFTGEKTGNTQVVLWILAMVAQHLCSDGLESANAKVSELTSKVEKYTDFLLPVACVAFAAYAMSGDKKFGVSNIAKTAKNSLGIDFDCLKNNDTLKMLFAVGLTALPAIMSFYNKSKTAIETEGGDAQVEPYFDKLMAQVKPLMSKIMKVLPAAIAICAVKLFDSSDATMEKVRMYLEGTLIMAKETLTEKFNLSEDFFSKENLKKVAVLALVAVVAFVAYRKNKAGENAQASNLVEQVLPKITPFLPLLVLAVPALKNFFADHGQEVDDFDDDEEESQDVSNAPVGEPQAEPVEVPDEVTPSPAESVVPDEQPDSVENK